MCIGTPMQVLEHDGSFAWCQGGAQRERLDMMLIGDQAPGTWVLAFLGVARHVLTEQEALRSSAAREALAAALAGDGQIDAFFADLVGREPELPAHLLPAAAGPVLPPLRLAGEEAEFAPLYVIPANAGIHPLPISTVLDPGPVSSTGWHFRRDDS
jgi:hydrogenase expression/formation protein HypC